MTAPPLPLKARLARITPYFAQSHRGFVLVIVGALIVAATEPMIP